MSNCGNKIKNTCGSTNYATCINYETDLPEFSEIEGCTTIEETTNELYTLVGEIKEETDLTALGNLCLDYTLESGKMIVKNVLAKFEEIICEQQEAIETLQNRQLCDINISDCGLDISCLELPCDQSISTLADLLQSMITKICETP